MSEIPTPDNHAPQTSGQRIDPTHLLSDGSRMEAESLWHEPSVVKPEHAVWEEIERYPGLTTTDLEPHKTYYLGPSSLTTVCSINDREGVLQTLRGVIQADRETYGIVDIMDNSGKNSQKKPFTVLTRFSANTSERPELVGLATPDSPLRVGRNGIINAPAEDHAGSLFTVAVDKDWQTTVTNDGSPGGAKLVVPHKVTKQELQADQRVADSDIVSYGKAALSMTMFNPLDNMKLWSAKSAEVRSAIDKDLFRSEAGGVDPSGIEVRPGDLLTVSAAVEVGRKFGKQIDRIIHKEKQTKEDKLLVSTILDMGSRLIIDGMESRQMRLPEEFASTHDFLRLARKVPTHDEQILPRSANVAETLNRITGNKAKVVLGNRLQPAAEDYAAAVMKYFSLMLRETGEVRLSDYQADRLNRMLAASAEAEQAEKQIAA